MLYTLAGLHSFSHYTKAEFNINCCIIHSKYFYVLTAAYLRVDFLQNFSLFLVIVSGYLTIISRARMGWAIDSEAMRARGIIVLVKFQLVETKKLKARL